jgi:hypothetical protein
MITFPISYYPASSDESSQVQVLSERKGEIAEKIEDVQDSGLDESRKAAITDSLKEQSDGLNVQIRRKQAEKDNKEKLLTTDNENRRAENKALEKQTADSKSEALLDTLA